ncbi:MAG: hypothetical protein J6Y57_06635, partial [Lachnospiraceae bacterium]|nr:hypothetical protein [Lachnospiraceae bacterium]
MNRSIRAHLSVLLAALAAVLHWTVTFFTDSGIFEVPPSANLSDYIICRILVLPVLFSFYCGIARLITAKDRKTDPFCRIVLRALPYLPVMIAAACVKLPQGYLSNDEVLIATSALHLEHYTWFYYLTTYFYIICFMIIPVYLAPIVIKLLIEFLVIGYVI